jgi:hypothetical protein
MGAVHTIRLTPVTYDNSTLVELSAEYSSGEWTSQVVEDSKFKKREQLEALTKSL